MGVMESWFIGESAIIDGVCVFVLGLIAYFSVKYYKVRKNRNYLMLAFSFILLIGSLVLKIFIGFGAAYNWMKLKALGFGSINAAQDKYLSLSIFIIFFLYHFLMLGGYYFFYTVYDKQTKSGSALSIYLLAVLAYFSHEKPSVIHFSAFIILMLAVLQSISRYIDKKYPATKLLILSVAIITASQLVFSFADTNEKVYVTGEIVQLVGYVTLLVTFIAVLIYGRKKDKNGYYW